MIQKVPKIKFKIDPTQDINNYIYFSKTSDAKFLQMYLPKELHGVVKSNLSNKTKEIVVETYVADKFNDKKEAIAANIKNIQERWVSVEGEYGELVGRIFNNHKWPKGKYVGYASVFLMYPRDISEKTFNFPALKSNPTFAVATTAHEMLHFMFFDYIKEKYGIAEETKLKNKNTKYVWIVSETFNLVIETWKPYQKVFKTHGKPYDSAHATMYPKMKKLWEEKNDIDYLLSHYF